MSETKPKVRKTAQSRPSGARGGWGNGTGGGNALTRAVRASRRNGTGQRAYRPIRPAGAGNEPSARRTTGPAEADMHVRAALVEGPVGAETHTPAHPYGQSAPERTFPQRPERPAIDETDSPHAGRYGPPEQRRSSCAAPCTAGKNAARSETLVRRRGRLSAPPPYFDRYLPSRAGRTIRAGRTNRAEQTNQARRTGRISRTGPGEFPASRPPCLLIRPPHDSAHPASGIEHSRRNPAQAYSVRPRFDVPSSPQPRTPERKQQSRGWKSAKTAGETRRMGRSSEQALHENSGENDPARAPQDNRLMLSSSGIGPSRTLRAGSERIVCFAALHAPSSRTAGSRASRPQRKCDTPTDPAPPKRGWSDKLFQPSGNRKSGIVLGWKRTERGCPTYRRPPPFSFASACRTVPSGRLTPHSSILRTPLPQIRIAAPAFGASGTVRGRPSRERLSSGKPSAHGRPPPLLRSPAPAVSSPKPRQGNRPHRPASDRAAEAARPDLAKSAPRCSGSAPKVPAVCAHAGGTPPDAISRPFSRPRTTRSPSPAPPR